MNRHKTPTTPPAKIIIETPHVPTPTSPPWGIATKSIVAVVSLLLFTLIIWRFQSLIAPLVIALILAYLLNPLINLVEKRIGLKRGLAVLLIYVLLALVVLGSATVLGLVVANQVQWLSDELPVLIARAPALFESLLSYLPTGAISIGPYTFNPAGAFQGLDGNALAQQAASLVQPLFSTSGLLVGLLAQKTLNVLTLSFLIFVTSIYIARDIPRMGSAIGNLAHQPGYRQDAERLMHDFVQIWNSYLRGQVILGLVMGIIVGVVLAILGVNNALALGLLSGGLEFLPIVGPLIGGAAAVLVAFFQDGNYLGFSPFNFALLILVAMVILQQLENNLLVPRIVGDALDLHPIIVMISVLMGASLAGILGAVLAAPVVASLKLIGAYAWRKMLDLPPFPEPRVLVVDHSLKQTDGWRKPFQAWMAKFQAPDKQK
ncbi:MAG: AI-2E family transporter [Chloroflexi bacterium]|nr:AI-2E family transporter [Chloroflexota bacterium]